MELMKEQKQMVFSGNDPNLPGWFTTCINGLAKKELTLLLEDTWVDISGNPEHFQAQYVEEEGERKGVAVLCTLVSEDYSLGQLLEVNGEPVLLLPDAFNFLTRSIKGLDVCFTYIAFFGEKSFYTEQFVICYQEKIQIIKGFLEIEKAYLQVLRQGISSQVVLAGECNLGEDMPFLIRLDFAPAQVRAVLGAKEGAFPSLLTFLKCIAQSLDLDAVFGWLGDVQTIFDVALAAASFTLDISTGKIEDYMVEAKLSLWGLDLDVTYYGAAKLLRGTTWQQKPCKVGEFLQALPHMKDKIPQEIAAVQMTQCAIEIQLERQEYTLTCQIENDCAIAGFTLQGVRLEVQVGEHVAFQVKGRASFQDTWLLDVAMDYKGKDKYTLLGSLVLQQSFALPQVPFLSDVLPKTLDAQLEPFHFTLQEGKITEASLTLQLVRPEEKKTELAPVYERKEKADKSVEIVKTQEVAQQGALREGEGTRWQSLHKQLGPFILEKVGLSFDNNIIAVILDGGLALGPVRLMLLGLSLGYDLREKCLYSNVEGLSLACHTDAFTLAGMIHKDDQTQPGVRHSFSGFVALQLTKWELGAMASYAELEDGTISFFVFLNCQVMLTAMPAFTITGLMGGLGVNESLRLPSVEEVASFPLLSMDPQKDNLAVLGDLQHQHYIEPAKGEYWAALGMSFEAWGLLKGKVLLSALFGQEFQAALIGSAEVTLPKGADKDNAYAYIKILLSAILRPKVGTFLAEAMLSDDSFVLCKDCHLFGQIACAIWFNPHARAGDFVVTLGGYHPAFEIPAHYPKVRQVGFSWQVNAQISAKGSVYMAVTPSCIMAGGNLEFLFSQGNLRAWFTAYAHLLMQWHPFAFDAQIGVEIGISYRLFLLFCHKTIRIVLGASLHLWGAPMGGKLRIHLSFLSFTISFGKPQNSGRTSLNWQELRASLLQEKHLHTIQAAQGVRTQQERGAAPTKAGQQEAPEPWIAETGEFSLFCETAIPVGTIHLRPMQLANIDSIWNLTITAPDQTKGSACDFGFTLEETSKNLPDALFGQPKDKLNDPQAKLVQGLTGYRLTTPPKIAQGELRILNYREALIRSLQLPNPLKGAEGIPAAFGQETGETLDVLQEIDSEAMIQQRQELCAWLGPYYQGQTGEFRQTKDNRYHLYTHCPMLCQEANGH